MGTQSRAEKNRGSSRLRHHRKSGLLRPSKDQMHAIQHGYDPSPAFSHGLDPLQSLATVGYPELEKIEILSPTTAESYHCVYASTVTYAPFVSGFSGCKPV